jgi:hypothetical protein
LEQSQWRKRPVQRRATRWVGLLAWRSIFSQKEGDARAQSGERGSEVKEKGQDICVIIIAQITSMFLEKQ